MLNSEQIKELKSKPLELFTLARYMYRIGHPFLKDSYYDGLERFIRSKAPELDILKRSYDDDPVPVDLVTKYFGEDYLVDFSNSKWRNILKEEKSLSIMPVTTMKQAHELLLKYNGLDVVWSLKKDGVNEKSAYKKVFDKFNFLCSLSRGRRGESREYVNLKKSAPTVIDSNLFDNMSEEILEIRGEAIVTSEGLEVLRRDFKDSGVGFVTAKSAALSMLTTKYPDEYYKYLKVFAFYCPGLSNTVSGTFRKLENMGFSVPEYKVIKNIQVPTDFQEFKEWITPILNEMWEISKDCGTKSDGVVVEIDDLNYDTNIKGQYADRNIALKILNWSGRVYTSKLLMYRSDQQRTKCSLTGIVEPVDTGNGVCTEVSLYNPSVAVHANAKIGEYISFVRKSETVSVLVYGEELNKLLDECGPEEG